MDFKFNLHEALERRKLGDSRFIGAVFAVECWKVVSIQILFPVQMEMWTQETLKSLGLSLGLSILMFDTPSPDHQFFWFHKIKLSSSESQIVLGLGLYKCSSKHRIDIK